MTMLYEKIDQAIDALSKEVDPDEVLAEMEQLRERLEFLMSLHHVMSYTPPRPDRLPQTQAATTPPQSPPTVIEHRPLPKPKAVKHPLPDPRVRDTPAPPPPADQLTPPEIRSPTSTHSASSSRGGVNSGKSRSQKLNERRIKAVHYIATNGPKGVFALASALDIPEGSISNVINHEWFCREAGKVAITTLAHQEVIADQGDRPRVEPDREIEGYND